MSANPTAQTNRPWQQVAPPATRPLKIYACDPSAGNYFGNLMTVHVPWEPLKSGPVGAKIAVINHDAANGTYYAPVDLDDPHILIRGGLDPSESDPRFHQQMVYAVASETINKFEAALGRQVHGHQAERPIVGDEVSSKTQDDSTQPGWRKSDDIWVLHLYPHSIQQENAFYSRE